jgi:hypothetical protein
VCDQRRNAGLVITQYYPGIAVAPNASKATAPIELPPDLREALLKIMTGQDTAPFATMFAVYASTVTKMHDPVFIPIELDIDVDARKGRAFVKDYIDMTGRPIRNAVSGQDSRGQIVLPDGFEYAVAEIGSASSRTGGPVRVEIEDKYGQFARLHLNNDGVVRARAAA